MYIIILASTLSTAKKMQTDLGNTADRYTIAVSWSDLIISLQKERPDLILIERTILPHIELATLLKLTESNRWPPLLITDALDHGLRSGITAIQHLIQTSPPYYQVGELRIDTRKRRARIDDRWVHLPPIQYRLLLALAQRAGEVIDCQELLRLVWGYDAGEVEARELVKVHIRQIRRRLELDPEKHHYIHSIRGFGYMLAPPEED